jgi:hypothetical protein
MHVLNLVALGPTKFRFSTAAVHVLVCTAVDTVQWYSSSAGRASARRLDRLPAAVAHGDWPSRRAWRANALQQLGGVVAGAVVYVRARTFQF